MPRHPLAAVTIALGVASSVHAQTHVYVDDDAPAGGDGLSWDPPSTTSRKPSASPRLLGRAGVRSGSPGATTTQA